MAFREVRDPVTDQFVCRYDPDTDQIEYRAHRKETRVVDLGPIRRAAKEETVDARSRHRLE